LSPPPSSSNKIQHGDILVTANPGPPGKWPLKWRESVILYGHKYEMLKLKSADGIGFCRNRVGMDTDFMGIGMGCVGIG